MDKLPMTTEHVGNPRALLIVAEDGSLYAMMGGNVRFDGCDFSMPTPRKVIAYFLKEAMREVMRYPFGKRAKG